MLLFCPQLTHTLALLGTRILQTQSGFFAARTSTSCTSQICRAGLKQSRQSPDLGQQPLECESESFGAGSRSDEKKKGGKKVSMSWHRPAACGSTDARRRSEERLHQSIATSLFLFVLEMSSGRGALPSGQFEIRQWLAVAWEDARSVGPALHSPVPSLARPDPAENQGMRRNMGEAEDLQRNGCKETLKRRFHIESPQHRPRPRVDSVR